MIMTVIRSEKGAALILVILIVSVIIAVTMELNASSRANVYEAANFRDRIKTLYIAKSGFNAAGALLLGDTNSYDSLTEIWARTEILSPYSAQLFEGDGRCTLIIEDESGRIPVHRLAGSGPDSKQYREILVRFLSLPEFNLQRVQAEDIVDSLRDWMDRDENITGRGAESSYYMALSPPYRAKNDTPDSVDELLLVKGITPEIFFGAEGRPGIRDFLTVYGEGRININTAPKLVLRALSADITPERADAIDSYRRDPANSLSDSSWYKKVDGMAKVNLTETLISVKSRDFRITSIGILSTMRETVTGVIERDTGAKKIRVLFWKTGS
jgi:general secretion pathway protein K